MDEDVGLYLHHIRQKSTRVLLAAGAWFFFLLWAIIARADLALLDLLVEPSRFSVPEVVDLLVLVVVVVGPVIAAPLWILNNLRLAAEADEQELRQSLGHEVPEPATPETEAEGLPLGVALAGMGAALAVTLVCAFGALQVIDLDTESGATFVGLIIVIPVGAAMNYFMMGDSDD